MNDFLLSKLCSQILLSIKDIHNPKLKEILTDLITEDLEPKSEIVSQMPSYHQDLQHSLEHFPDQTNSFQKDTAFLSNQVLWHEGSRGVPEFFKGGYSFSEVIGKSGLYHHDFLRLGLYIQAASIDYPAHAHEAEECYLILNGQADWQIGEQWHHGEPGSVFHHHPSVSHRMITHETPLLAIWMWTGKIQGRYWFVGSEEIDCQPK